MGLPARAALLGFVVAASIAALVGLLLLWPDAAAVDEVDGLAGAAAPGVTYPQASVLEVQEPCTDGAATEACGNLVVRVEDGTDSGSRVTITAPPEVLVSGLGRGDHVELVRTPGTADSGPSWTYQAADRDASLAWLVGLFVLVVLAVARLRGLMALLGLAFSAGVLWRFTLPALLVGENGLAVALTTATLIMVVVLYATHGPSLRTSAALVGTLLGVGVTVAVALVWAHQARLTGISDESGGLLSAYASDIDFRGLLACAFVIAGLGVLNDVTITQASAVWELRAAAPGLSRPAVWRSAMRIGRDHIASTIYTITFAYAGSALIVLMLLVIYDRPLLELLSTEQLAEEIVRTLTGAIGVVLAVPLTTAVAVGLVGRGALSEEPAPTGSPAGAPTGAPPRAPAAPH